MRRMYWRPRKVSLRSIVILCVVALGGVAVSEAARRQRPSDPLAERKLAAAQLAEEAFAAIKQERLRRGHVIRPELDPAETGLIGEYLTPVTSTTGHLGSKQTSANPNFAAVVVEMLEQAGVREGDVVAVGCSGSFPALNVCVFCALETLGVEPIVVASAAASQFGANMPDLLWIDMERHLRERGLVSFGSVAASYGGFEDLAVGMTEEGRQLITEAIRRNQLPLIEEDDYESSLEARMALYEQHAAGRPVQAYINIGGGSVSVGRSTGKKLYQPGLNLETTEEALEIDSVLTRFARKGTPVIHLVEVQDIARAYRLPNPPQEMIVAGEGELFYNVPLGRQVAGGALLVIVAMLAVSYRRGPGAPLKTARQASGADVVLRSGN